MGDFCYKREDLARAIADCDECLRVHARMENKLEDVWPALFTQLKFANRDGYLHEVPDCCKQQVWYFLVEVATRRPKFYSKQTQETARNLYNVPAWAQVVDGDRELAARRRLYVVTPQTNSGS